MGYDLVKGLADLVNRRMDADASIGNVKKMAAKSRTSNGTIGRVKLGETAVGIDKLSGIASALNMSAWELVRSIEIGDAPGVSSQAASTLVEVVHPLVSKLAAAIQAGQLSETALDMLEAALDSQLIKAGKPAGSNVAVPPPSILLELRTAQLSADAGTATPESISAMNQRIRSRSNAERNRAQSSVVGDGERRNKKDR